MTQTTYDSKKEVYFSMAGGEAAHESYQVEDFKREGTRFSGKVKRVIRQNPLTRPLELGELLILEGIEEITSLGKITHVIGLNPINI